MASVRPRRVADLVRTVIAELLERKVQDPRVRGVQLTDVRVSPDLRQATLFYSLFPGGEAELKRAAAGLEHARGFLRRELAHRTRLRVTPELRFVPDHSLAHAAHIQDVLLDLGLPGTPPTAEADAHEEDDDVEADLRLLAPRPP